MYTTEENCVVDDDPWVETLAAAVFEIHYTEDRIKFHSPDQLIFLHGMILLIKNNTNC